MKRLAIKCSICLTIVGVAAPIAVAEPAPRQPSAMERLIRQEDVRRNDPRLGLAEKPAPQESAVERLVRQEDARASDPRLGVASTARRTSEPPTVRIIAGGGFDWLAVTLGVLGGMALALTGAGFLFIARSHRPSPS